LDRKKLRHIRVKGFYRADFENKSENTVNRQKTFQEINQTD